MPKHKILVKETSKFIVEIEAPNGKKAQEIFEDDIKAHGDKITRHIYTEWMVLEVNGKQVQIDHPVEALKPITNID